MDPTKRIVALTVPIAFIGVLLGATVRDRTLDPTVAGGLVAILGAIVAGVFGAGGGKGPPPE